MLFRLFAIFVFCLAMGASAAPAALHAESFADRFITAKAGNAVPSLSFTNDQGVTEDLTGYRGRYVLLNLWATWCGPCVNEMPTLNDLQTKFDYRDLNIIALNEDRNGVAIAQSFYARHTLKNLRVYVDASGQVPFLLHSKGLPTTLLIDKAGHEVGRIDGEVDWSAPDVVAFLRSKIK